MRIGTLLEAWEVAPFPQFRLNTSSKETQHKTPTSPESPVVCSLRTVLPHTVARNPNASIPNWAPDLPNLPVERETESQFEFHHPLNPSGTALQKNVTGSRNTKEHVITLSCFDNINPESVDAKNLEAIGRGRETGTGDIVRNLQIGDVVTVWAKARYSQWINHVEEVKIDIYWAV